MFNSLMSIIIVG